MLNANEIDDNTNGEDYMIKPLACFSVRKLRKRYFQVAMTFSWTISKIVWFSKII